MRTRLSLCSQTQHPALTTFHPSLTWVFEGLTESIARIDFRADHGPGYDDHSDGVVARYAIRKVKRVPDVPSHLELDPETGLLYIADTGHARVAVLDTTLGTPGRIVEGVEPGTQIFAMQDAGELTTLADEASDLIHPSGLALHDGHLFVTDNATSRILAFDLDGELIDWLDTGLPAGALMGLTFDEAGRLYYVDAVDNRLMVIAPRVD